MRILLQLSTFGFRSYHSFAKKIKELNPNTSFGIAGSAKPADDFLRKQKDIDYWRLKNTTRSTLKRIEELKKMKVQNRPVIR